MNEKVDSIIQHIIEVGKQDIYGDTYEEGIEQGARLMIAYGINNNFFKKEFLDEIFQRVKS